MRIERRLGYFTMDNAANNDKALTCISDYCSELGIQFNAKERRIRCFGHVLNLTVKAFLWGENTNTIETTEALDDVDMELERLREWRKRGPLGKLYNCIRYTMKTPQRREKFEEPCRTYLPEGQVLSLIIGNATRWNGDHDAIVRALVLREPLEDYMAFVIRMEGKASGETSIANDILSGEDWQELRFMVEALAPFKKWTLLLERNGDAAQLSDILPAFDDLLTHLEEVRVFHTHSDGSPSTHIVNSPNAAWAILNK